MPRNETPRTTNSRQRAASHSAAIFCAILTLVMLAVVSFYKDEDIARHLVANPFVKPSQCLKFVLYTKIMMLVGLLCALFLAVRTSNRKLELLFQLSSPALATFLLSQLIHIVFPIPRPFIAMGFGGAISAATDSSFPSDFAAVGTAVAVAILRYSRILGILSLAWTAFFCFIEVLLLNHWPSDVFVGAVIGAVASLEMPRVQARIRDFLGPSTWKSLFESDEKFGNLIAGFRLVATFGILLRIATGPNILKAVTAPHAASYSLVAYYTIAAIWIAFFFYALLSNSVLVRLASLSRRQIADGHITAQVGFERSLWRIICIDYVFYTLFYIYTGRAESNVFAFFIIPLVMASLFRDFPTTMRVLTVAVAALGVSLFSIFVAYHGEYSPYPGSEISAKQYFALSVFAPRLFMLILALVPVAWLVQKHFEAERAKLYYESLVESIPQMIIRKDPNGMFTYANKAFRDLNKCANAEIIGFNDASFYDPDLAAKYRRSDLEAAERQEPTPIDERHRPRKSNDEIDVEGNRIPVRDKSGNLLEMQIIFWNVTERRRREAQFNALMTTTSDHIYFKDRESRFLEISSAQARMFGLNDRSEAVGKSDHDFFERPHADEAKMDETRIMECDGVIIDKEEEEIRNGKSCWVSTTKHCFYDQNRRLIGTFGISRSIQLRKDAQAQAASAEKRLRESLDLQLEEASKLAHFGFWEWNIYEVEQSGMKAMDEVYRIFGFRPQQKDVTLRDLRDRVHPDDLPIWDENFSIAKVAPPFHAFHLRICVGENNIKYLFAKCEIKHADKYGLAETLIGFVQDITEQKLDQLRAGGLELAIRGFHHMVPGKAEVAKCGLENLTANGNCPEGIRKALYFIFMIRHKAYEVKSILLAKSFFVDRGIGEILMFAWPIATDLARCDCKDLTIVYDKNITAAFEVNGALYTAAVNILCNARMYGTAPFVVWIVRTMHEVNVVFCDGGPQPSPYSADRSPQDHGVGLKLVERILGIAGGQLMSPTANDLVQQFSQCSQIPEFVLNCRTFYQVRLTV